MQRSRVLLVLVALAGAAFVPVPSPGLVTHGPRRARRVALTFDADMTHAMLAALARGAVRRWYDPGVLAELRRTRTPATIFLTGLWAASYPGLVRRLARDPRLELENHSFDHAAWQTPCYGLATVAGEAAKRAEVERAAAVVDRLTGRAPRYFRFPGGCQSAADVRLVRSLGEVPVQWDVISGDSYLRRPADVARQVLAEVRPGSIVVMHLNGPPRAPATAGALRIVIPALRREGYGFETVAMLLSGRG